MIQKSCADLLTARSDRWESIQSTENFFSMRPEYDYVVWATYGLGPSRGLFKSVKYQVAEKVLIQYRTVARRIVVSWTPVYRVRSVWQSERSMWGSAKHSITGHTDPAEPMPLSGLASLERTGSSQSPGADLRPCGRIRRRVPASAEAVYLGSRFTIRVVENDPQDRRTLYVQETARAYPHLLQQSGERGEAARLVSEKIAQG